MQMTPQKQPAESVTRQLAEALAAATFADLPPHAIMDTRRSVLDWLGSALAGAVEPPARMVQSVVATLGRSDDATVFAGGRSSAAGAALANGVASHILELDDIHKGSTVHAAAPIIPAALAVAEREHADGQRFLLAVAVGYEAALRIGEAVNPSHYRFWHPTGTAATFGAAAAAGSLLQLSVAQMLDALGSAGTQAAGLWEFNADGAMSKHLHPGKAAFNGILAADLARQGFTGASRILEGERGFFRAMSESHDASRITDGLRARWKISENCYKLHACCGHTHSAIDLALEIRAENGWSAADVLEQVAGIHIETYGPGYEIVKNMAPATPYQAKFSIAYCVAAALLEGRGSDGGLHCRRRDRRRYPAQAHTRHRGQRPHREVPRRLARTHRHHAPRWHDHRAIGRLSARQSRESRIHRGPGGEVPLPGSAPIRTSRCRPRPGCLRLDRDLRRHGGSVLPSHMKDINPRSNEFPEYRQAIRELCRQFDSQYWWKVEEESAYPEEFVKALTEAGWLAALIPAEYGGGGLASPKRRSSWKRSTARARNSGACHAQMYIMGTLLRHGSRAQKQELPAEDRLGRTAPAVLRRHRAHHRHRHDQDQDRRPCARATATSSTARRS